MPTEQESQRRRWASQATKSWVPPAESVRIRVCRPRRHFFGSWARARRVAVMWSAAVFEPALPGLSRAATGSPVPPRAVVDESHQRMVAVGPLPSRGRVLLVRVRDHQHPVQVDRHPFVRVPRLPVGQAPDIFTDFGPCGADSPKGGVAGGGEGGDQAGGRRVGGDRSEHGRLGPQHADIGQAVPAHRDCLCEVQEDLPGILDGPRLPPGQDPSCGPPSAAGPHRPGRPPHASCPRLGQAGGYDPLPFFTRGVPFS